MRRRLWATVVSFVALTGCAGRPIHGITPIYPDIEDARVFLPRFPPPVDSLQPTFRWEPAPESGALYDFIIYEGHKPKGLVGFACECCAPVIGNEVYYREGLKDPEYKLEVTLQPDRAYYWSVRVRRGEYVSEWSRFDKWRIGFFNSCRLEFPFFVFKTPAK